jgi:diguanylate cyclase (GGDEF)-like protein
MNQAPVRLVLVEDADADAELIARQLAQSHLSFDIHRVQTERAFLDALRTVRPDLILSDFSMPRFDGLHALELASEHARDTPFIFVSGTIGEERAIDALRRGATDYILKSNLSRLTAAVERAVREGGLRSMQRSAEQRLRRLTRTYRMLSSTSSAILRLHDRMDLLEEICRIAVEQGGYERVVISLIDPGSGLLRPRAWAGADSHALRGFDRSAFERAVTSGAPVHPIYSGATMLLNDVTTERPDLGQVEVLKTHGYRAFAALPVLIDGTTVGVITLFSRQHDVFDRAEVEVLLELSANLGFALQYLERDEAVHFLSYYDSLTGLAKRALFCQRLEHLLSSRAQTDSESEPTRAVLVFDIQQLGAINDSFGRYVGDRLLERIAARLKQTHGAELAAHFGGGTFAVLLQSASSAVGSGHAGQMPQNAAAHLFAEPFAVEGHELRPGVRAGIAFWPQDAAGADALVQNAEAALKAAREDRERYLPYALVRQRPSSRHLALEGRLAGALLRNELLLHYQPKINLASGRVEGLEALLRWQDVQEGLVPPSLFIPLLERSGTIAEVGWRWVSGCCSRPLPTWHAGAPVACRASARP